MKKNILKENYDYNNSIKKKTDYIAEKLYGINDEITKSKLFNLAVNLCNQMIYDYVYIFTKEDLYFIAEYNINVYKLVDSCVEDIKLMYNREKNREKNKEKGR